LTIKKIDAIPVRTPMRSFTDAYSAYSMNQFVLIRIENDDGKIGYGEAPCTVTVGFYGETLESTTIAIRNYIAPALRGADPLNIRRAISIVNQMHGAAFLAKTGIDIALHDLVGKILNVPTSTLLGGAQRATLPVASEIGIVEPEQAAKESLRLVDLGFRAIKLKAGNNAETDVKNARAVRDQVGDEVELRVDPNAGWTRYESLKAIKELTKCDLEYVEQPLPRWDLEGLAYLRKMTGVPIMVDESVWNPHDVMKVVEAKAADLINIKITKAGGLKNSIDIYTTAQASGIPCIVGTELEACVAAPAKLQLASSFEDLPFAVEFTELAYQNMLLDKPLKIENGCLHLPGGPGSGLEPDLKSIEQHKAAM